MNGLGNKEIFAKNLQHYMAINNKSRYDLCNDLGFKYSTLCNWLYAEKYPRIDKIEILANYFGINKSDLVENHSSPAAARFPARLVIDSGKISTKGLSDDEVKKVEEYIEFIISKRNEKKE